MPPKNLYLIAGCNGAGKTTASYTILPYHVTLLFFWLQNVEMAQERVKIRGQEGGHNIPKNVIERRYILGIKNLFNLYLPIVDEALIFDNSENDAEKIAEKITNTPIKIINSTKFNFLKQYQNG